MSTGAILLADIIPSFIIKCLSPFLPYSTNHRILISCLTSVVSFLAVAFAGSNKVVIIGVILTSFASGLGEPTFLAHSTRYHKNVVSTWSSGTGGAGVIGALSYSLMREVGLTSRQTLLIMLVVPALELLTYFFLLSKPYIQRDRESHLEDRPLIDDGSSNRESANRTPLNSLAQKLAFIPELMIYFIPLAMVYFFEYFINQGLVGIFSFFSFNVLKTRAFRLQFELITFPNSSMTTAQQYRWYQVTYQIGVFVSRSSVNLIHIKRTWIMAAVQGFIAGFFLIEAVFLFIPTLSVIFVVIFIEGLQGGLAYVNTYYRMSKEIPAARREFAMNVVASSDSMGIILAGIIAIPTHNWICQLPGVTNFWWNVE